MVDLLTSYTAAPFGRAVWVAPRSAEGGAPERRIIHNRGARLPSKVRLQRLGVRLTTGYFKCGSEREIDWITAFRVHVWNGERWEVVRDERGLARPKNEGDTHWFDLVVGGHPQSPALTGYEARREAE